MYICDYDHNYAPDAALAEPAASTELEAMLASFLPDCAALAQGKEGGSDAERSKDLKTTEKGGSRDLLYNGTVVLRQDPAFQDRIRFDQLRSTVVCRDMPWQPSTEWREWTNTDDLRLAEWCQKRNVLLKPTTCADAVAVVAQDHAFHSVRDYLDGLAWDGVKRIDTWLADYLGVKTGNPEYVRAVGRKWLIAAAARVSEPGCKVDTVLTLEGEQGAGKSSALAALVPNQAWFADEISDLGTKDSAQDLCGKWLIEIPELSAMRRSDIERTKAFVSRAIDHYRPSYGRRSQDFPRQCVFAGTTNAETYLGDETGNRRFWPVKVSTIDLEALRRDRDQLWAETVVAYKAGEQWWLDPKTEALAAAEQGLRRTVDPWEENLLTWASKFPAVTTSQALAHLGMDTSKRDQQAENRVARILKGAGWKRHLRRKGGIRSWEYRAPASLLSPVPQGRSGDGKANDSNAVTSVTAVTSRAETLVGHGG